MCSFCIISLKKVKVSFVKFLAWGSLIIYPYSLSKIVRRLTNKFLSKRFVLLTSSSGSAYLHSPFYVAGHKYISFGSFAAGPGFRIECLDYYMGVSYTPSITIGDNVGFNCRCHIGAIDKIVIGNNVLIGSQVLITDHSHGESTKEALSISPVNRELYSKGPVIIEDNVWIGEGVCILPNVRVGRNSIIGANSVVIHDVPPFCVVAGNPARVIKKIEI